MANTRNEYVAVPNSVTELCEVFRAKDVGIIPVQHAALFSFWGDSYAASEHDYGVSLQAIERGALSNKYGIGKFKTPFGTYHKLILR